jgi:hypothetical protein
MVLPQWYKNQSFAARTASEERKNTNLHTPKLIFSGGSLEDCEQKTTEKVGARRRWIFLERLQRSNQPLVLCEVVGRCRLPASERIITQALVQRRFINVVICIMHV